MGRQTFQGMSVIAAAVLVIASGGCSPSGTASDGAGSESALSPVGRPEVWTAADAAEWVANADVVTVVNFWATWCPPCVAEQPELAEFFEAHQPKGVEFLSITVDHPDMIDEDLIPFLQENPLPFRIVVLDQTDPDAVDTVDEAFGIEMGGAVPVTAIYDADGQLVHAWYEEVTAELLAEKVAPLLGDVQD